MFTHRDLVYYSCSNCDVNQDCLSCGIVAESVIGNKTLRPLMIFVFSDDHYVSYCSFINCT